MITDKLRTLWKTVFGDTDAFLDAFFTIAYSPDRCRYLTEGEEVVSALYWFDCEYAGGKLAYIYAVATNPKHRGKGLASRLLLETHALLKGHGYAGAVLKPAKGLFPFYERLGYETCGYIRRFTAAPGSPIALKELDTQTYAARRKTFLPDNSILQEGVTLEFLHSFARFYDAGDALVCAAPEENVIFEYLGDPDIAPGVLAALVMPEGSIPTVGNEIPFAMFYPLNCTNAPGYLGITLE